MSSALIRESDYIQSRLFRKVFGAIDIILEAFIVGYAIYDIMTDTGMLAGIFGFLMLCFVAPIPVILLIADIFLYFLKARRSRKKRI